MKGKIIFKQLKEDLTGKDAYRGITLTYAWLANQFGHFSLGFIPSMLLYQTFEMRNYNSNPLFSSLLVAIFWVIFELGNFLIPLFIEVKPKHDFPFFQQKDKYTFAPRWLNVGFDTFTDICFFMIGAFTYSLLISYSLFNLLLLLLLLGIIFQPCNYWFLTKMYQLNAKYPFQFRLSQWNLFINENDKEKVLNFMNDSEKSPKHLLIFGDHKCGKTSLAIGISNELSIKQKPCLYINAMKLLGQFYEHHYKDETNDSVWSWDEVEYLIIDDINPGCPINEELITAYQFLKFIDTGLSINEKNRKILRKKNVIWVLGNKKNMNQDTENSWRQMLKIIGLNSKDIIELNLTKDSCTI